MNISSNGKTAIEQLKTLLHISDSFDLVFRDLTICNHTAAIFFTDGLVKDEVTEKLLEFFYSIKDENMLKDAQTFAQNCVPYIEAGIEADLDKITCAVLSGILVLIIDGLDKAVLIDVRTYPQRENAEPEKDKVLRGSNDAFVETLVANTALIRRRIRDTNLRMKYFCVGSRSKTDVALCYMSDKVDKRLLEQISSRIENANVSSLTMNLQSLSEAIYRHKWYNPFPKMKFSERPDTAASAVLDGNIVIICDNAPMVMIIPTSIFDVLEEADDYYFPPITGTYIRLTRWAIVIASLLITPLWLLALQYPQYVPPMFQFILIDDYNIPIFWQLMILEIAVDGLRLAAINTPNMLTTPLSIIGGIALSDFAVSSGWFSSEAILYMAFAAITSYSQPSYELGYAIKFMRIIILVLTEIFGIWGFAAGIVFSIVVLVTNRTVSGKSYLYPLIPFNGKKFMRKVLRFRHE